MIIFLGGLVGAGKTSLAKGIARVFNAAYYDIDHTKMQIYPPDDYWRKLQMGQPVSDELRLELFRRVLNDLAALAKQHSIVVTDEILHKRELRRILFDGALQLVGARLVVWIKASDSVIRARLASCPREGHILTRPDLMYASIKKIFEDINEADIVFDNNEDGIAAAVGRLACLLRPRVLPAP
jgi:gluconate kinase